MSLLVFGILFLCLGVVSHGGVCVQSTTLASRFFLRWWPYPIRPLRTNRSAPPVKTTRVREPSRKNVSMVAVDTSTGGGGGGGAGVGAHGKSSAAASGRGRVGGASHSGSETGQRGRGEGLEGHRPLPATTSASRPALQLGKVGGCPYWRWQGGAALGGVGSGAVLLSLCHYFIFFIFEHFVRPKASRPMLHACLRKLKRLVIAAES